VHRIVDKRGIEYALKEAKSVDGKDVEWDVGMKLPFSFFFFFFFVWIVLLRKDEHLISMYYRFVFEGKTFFILEYANSKSLMDYMKNSKVSEQNALGALYQICIDFY
jgi:serine/threonine protein kinase